MRNKYNEKLDKLIKNWKSMTDAEKCNFAVENAGVRKAHYFKDAMKIMCNISDIQVFNMISDMFSNWEDMNNIEREYIAYKLFGEKSSKVFKLFINMVADAVKAMNEDVKDRNEFGVKNNPISESCDSYESRLKARREQIYREIRELSGDNIPEQIKALQEQLNENIASMKALVGCNYD